MSLARPTVAHDPGTAPGARRGAIVAALDGVEGLTGYRSAPDQATAGAAWPRLIQTTYDGNIGYLASDRYDVLVTLPADYAAQTVDDGDSYRDLVALALFRVGTVQYAEPVSIAFADRQTMPGLRFRLVT